MKASAFSDAQKAFILKRGQSPREAFHEEHATVVWPLQL